MVINTNIAALNSANNLNQSTNALNESLARLSSGSKIVSASDNPAGLAESMQLNEQIGQTNAGNANVSNALSFSQTQDGYLQQISTALNQMAGLAVSAQDGTMSTSEVANYQQEFAALQSTITTALQATFNGENLFGSTVAMSVATGSGSALTLAKIDTTTTGSANLQAAIGTANLSTSATIAQSDVDNAISDVATLRGNIGANEEQLTYAGNEMSVLNTNLAAANSTITDVDVATESTNYAKEQILVQSGTSMLAQANQNPQSVLKLLQG
jgi:flagellin